MKPEGLLSWLFERKNVGVRPGLPRVRAMLERLGRPDRKLASILVAGTNGKGSVTASLASCLTAAGYRTARFTSPHLDRVTERFVVDGRELPFQHLVRVLTEVRDEADQIGASFFEITTAAAFRMFADEGVDYAVIEVGLGGRFDATNIVDPILSVITEIDLDHTGTLGTTVPEIAREKAGILRPGVRAVTSARGEGLDTIRISAGEMGAQLWALDEACISHEHLGWSGLKIAIDGWGNNVAVDSRAIGTHQVRNQALAVAAGWAMNLPNQALKQGIRDSEWPGRLERFWYRGREVVFDGAHNPAAARIVSAELSRLLPSGYTLLIGITTGKDAAGVIEPLIQHAKLVVLTEAASGPKGLSVEELSKFCAEAESVVDPIKGLGVALEQTPPGGSLVVAGSLYLVGILREMVLAEATPP